MAVDPIKRQEWDQKALEAIAIEGYRSQALSAGQVAEFLGISTIETETFLKERGVDLLLTVEDFEGDMEALNNSRHR